MNGRNGVNADIRQVRYGRRLLGRKRNVRIGSLIREFGHSVLDTHPFKGPSMLTKHRSNFDKTTTLMRVASPTLLARETSRAMKGASAIPHPQLKACNVQLALEAC